jgi:hypothetical protein
MPLLADLTRPRLVHLDVPLEGLPPQLDGYRVGQISDVHCGRFTPPERVAEWVAALNAERPDLIAVTGDLITSGDRYLSPIAELIGGLYARDGVYGVMGNHDYFTDGEAFARLLERRGLLLLRNTSTLVRTRGAALYVAGSDDTWTRRADVAQAMAAHEPGTPSLLLAHDPNLFPRAARHGASLTLSGHTHGGQVALRGRRGLITPARLITPFPAGLYARGDARLYVSCGAGTTGPPIRFGAHAELTVLTLRRALPRAEGAFRS